MNTRSMVVNSRLITQDHVTKQDDTAFLADFNDSQFVFNIFIAFILGSTFLTDSFVTLPLFIQCRSVQSQSTTKLTT